MKTAEQFLSYGQGNVEALVKSGQIVASGLQDMSKQMVATTQSMMEDGMSTLRAISGVRSIREAFDLQASFARSSFEKAMTQSGQFAEASFKLAEQAFSPLAQRATLAVESIKTA